MEFELDIIRALQSIHNPLLDALSQGITMFGEQTIIAVLLAFFYWCQDKERAKSIGLSVFFSAVLNGFLKGQFDAPRPIGQPGIRSLRLHTATGASFPSGHSQAAGSAYTGIALIYGKRWLWALCSILMLLVGLSRLYLGVHYPRDVVVGLLLGVLVSVLMYKLYQNMNRTVLYVGAILLCLLFGLFGVTHDFMKGAGGLIGFCVGCMTEERFIQFKMPENMKHKLLRVFIGFLPILALRLLFGVFDDSELLVFIEHLLIGWLLVAGAPCLFQRFKI